MFTVKWFNTSGPLMLVKAIINCHVIFVCHQKYALCQIGVISMVLKRFMITVIFNLSMGS